MATSMESATHPRSSDQASAPWDIDRPATHTCVTPSGSFDAVIGKACSSAGRPELQLHRHVAGNCGPNERVSLHDIGMIGKLSSARHLVAKDFHHPFPNGAAAVVGSTKQLSWRMWDSRNWLTFCMKSPSL